ncbi:MAG: DUF362 domain-containing protein [Sphaerochaetaceae bacterium]|nr:DUF362 domain-containing protein [Sphaerochaetaceae bacterium]MDD4396643.1 DUF362 domain-containing protein [Sphaerochaetaceae bacterium]
MKSKVYFTDFRIRREENLIEKFDRLYDKAGLGKIDMKDKFVAIKMHFGEMGNLAYLRHNYAAGLVAYIKRHGGKPFLTDCNTLYTGSRTNALDHLETAFVHGFSFPTTGAQVIIADGLKGDDEASIPVQGARYCQTALIGRALADADIIISLTHFKGHESAGFGGALKNLGMGGGSRAGKKDMHSSCKPQMVAGKCIACHKCDKACAHGAPDFSTGKCVIDYTKCVGCGRCVEACPTGAIIAGTDENFKVLDCKIAEYTKAVINGKPNFHIAFVMDISPFCDCYPNNDAPIVPDVGVFASSDPVAIDVACADAVNRMPANPDSLLSERCSKDHDHDHFMALHHGTDWHAQVNHGQEIGLGSTDYELITMQ